MRVLVLLQNAWRKGAQPGDTEFVPGTASADARRVWKRALWRSHTGKRLRSMLPDGCEVRVSNASPLIGGVSRAKFEMAPCHVRRQIVEASPDVVVLLGSEPAKARPLVEEAGIPVIVGPHPAFRLLTVEEAASVRDAIARMMVGVT